MGGPMKKAKVSFLYGPKDLRMKEIDIPDPAPEQVLIRVKACGICGSDVECFLGHSAEAGTISLPTRPAMNGPGRWPRSAAR